MDGQIVVCTHGKSRRHCSDCAQVTGLRSAPPPQETRISARDATQLTYGTGSAPVYHDPDAAVRARRMLLWVPTAPGFTDCLDDFENHVWSLCFDGQHTQAETAEIVHRRQGSISKIQDRCVRKMNDRYRALRSKDELPIAILAWMKDCGATADIRDDTFTNAVHLLR